MQSRCALCEPELKVAMLAVKVGYCDRAMKLNFQQTIARAHTVNTLQGFEAGRCLKQAGAAGLHHSAHPSLWCL